MSRFGPLLLAALLSSCGRPSARSVPIRPSVTAAASERHSATATASPVEAAASAPAAPIAHASLLQPASTEPLVSVSGCLANPEGAEQYAARTRSTAKRDTVAIAEEGNAFVITHSLGHECCLKLETSRTTEGDALVLHERLTGTPCHCRCDSRIRFFVEKPNVRRFRVETEWPAGHLRVAYAGPLTGLR